MAQKQNVEQNVHWRDKLPDWWIPFLTPKQVAIVASVLGAVGIAYGVDYFSDRDFDLPPF